MKEPADWGPADYAASSQTIGVFLVVLTLLFVWWLVS